MPLSDWLSTGRLAAHAPSAGEIASLLSDADRALAAAGREGVAPAERFRQAGRSARAVAAAALAAAGFRPAAFPDDAVAIDALTETVGAGPSLVHRLRTLFATRSPDGGPGVPVSPVDAEMMRLTAEALRIDVEKRIRSRRPELLVPAP